MNLIGSCLNSCKDNKCEVNTKNCFNMKKNILKKFKKCGVSDLRIESNKFISNQLCLKNAGEKCDFHSNCKSNYCFGKGCCSNDMLDNKFNLKPQFKDCSKCNKNTCEECIGGKFENNSCPKQNCNKVYQKR